MPKHKDTELSDRMIKALTLPPDKRQVEHFFNLYEGRSLILTVNKSRKTWSALFYTNTGKPRRKKLGTFPAMTAAKARAAANKFDRDEALETVEAGTFKKVSEEFLKRHVQENALRSEREITRILNFYVMEKWGKKQFADIDTEAVTVLMDHIVDHHGKPQADAVRAVISKIIHWHEDRMGGKYRRPHIPKRRQKPVKRQRWLTDDEIRALWIAADHVPIFGPMARILLLTGQRIGKVVKMKWEDINLETGEWRIPREAGEKGTPKAITLPRMALEVLEGLPRVLNNPYVFVGRDKSPSAAGGDPIPSHFNAFSKRKAALDKEMLRILRGYAIDRGEAPPTRFNTKEEEAAPRFKRKPDEVAHWQPHDLRRTNRKLLTRMRVTNELAKLVQGRVIEGVEAHYDDADEYRDQIDDALCLVAGEISRLLKPDAQVVVLRG